MRGRASAHRAKMRALHHMPLLQVIERALPLFAAADLSCLTTTLIYSCLQQSSVWLP